MNRRGFLKRALGAVAAVPFAGKAIEAAAEAALAEKTIHGAPVVREGLSDAQRERLQPVIDRAAERLKRKLGEDLHTASRHPDPDHLPISYMEPVFLSWYDRHMAAAPSEIFELLDVQVEKAVHRLGAAIRRGGYLPDKFELSASDPFDTSASGVHGERWFIRARCPDLSGYHYPWDLDDIKRRVRKGWMQAHCHPSTAGRFTGAHASTQAETAFKGKPAFVSKHIPKGQTYFIHWDGWLGSPVVGMSGDFFVIKGS